METIRGSTLAGPPLYLTIHPRFLSRVWVLASGDTEESSGVEVGAVGEGDDGGWICLG